MPTINRPCAYCGGTDSPRHRGHVFPKSMYPQSTPGSVQRRTVPECGRCAASWTDAETQFRNILCIAGDSNSATDEFWAAFLRSTEHYDAKRRLTDMSHSIEELEDGRLKVYPYRDPKVNLILRRIVRGLSAYHELESQVSDNRVWVGYLSSDIPHKAFEQVLRFSLGDEFVQYGYSEVNDRVETGILSVWGIRIFETRKFVGIISSFEDAAQRYAPVFNPQ